MNFSLYTIFKNLSCPYIHDMLYPRLMSVSMLSSMKNCNSMQENLKMFKKEEANSADLDELVSYLCFFKSLLGCCCELINRCNYRL